MEKKTQKNLLRISKRVDDLRLAILLGSLPFGPKKYIQCIYIYMGVSKNRDIPKSSILIGFWFSIINHPFWGTPVFGNTHITFHFFLLSRVVLHLRFLDADGKGDPKTILPNSGEKL